MIFSSLASAFQDGRRGLPLMLIRVDVEKNDLLVKTCHVESWKYPGKPDDGRRLSYWAR